MNTNESKFHYALRLYNTYSNDKLNYDDFNFVSSDVHFEKHVLDIAKFHLIILDNPSEYNSNVVFIMMLFLNSICNKKHTDGSDTILDLKNASITFNLDLYSQMKSNNVQINLIDILEKHWSRNDIHYDKLQLRSEPEVFKKVLYFLNLLKKIDYKVFITVSEFCVNVNENAGYWRHTPYEFSDNYLKIAQNYPINTINVYVDIS